jgi:AcrR family transcriptional regulator
MPPRDPEATKARIFDAATREFAAYGIAGARVDRIARHAQANKQLLYAYFGDKEQLFHQVLERAMVDAAASVITDIDDVDVWVDQHIEYHRRHPEFARLMLWEALELGPDRASGGEARIGRYALKQAKVADAQRRGVVRSDMPPAVVVLIMLSVVNYAQAVPQVTKFLLGDDVGPEELRKWLEDAMRRIVAPGP